MDMLALQEEGARRHPWTELLLMLFWVSLGGIVAEPGTMPVGPDISPGQVEGHGHNSLPWAGHTLSQTSLLMTTWLSDRDLMARTIIFSTIGLLP